MRFRQASPRPWRYLGTALLALSATGASAQVEYLSGGAWGGGGGGVGGGHVIEEEATPLAQRSNLNFTGSGITCSDSGGKTVCNAPGGAAAFPLQGGTGCATMQYSFTGDTDSGLCLTALNDVILQSSNNDLNMGKVRLQAGAATLYYYDAASNFAGLIAEDDQLGGVLNNAIYFRLNLTEAIFGNNATQDRLSIAPPALGGGSFKGTFTSADLTADRTWTFPNASGTMATLPLQAGTGCTNPLQYGFSADTDAGMCLNAAADVRLQNTAGLGAGTAGAGLTLTTAAGTPYAILGAYDTGNAFTGIQCSDPGGGNEECFVQLNGVTKLQLISSSLWTAGGLVFEGSTADAFELTLAVADPQADRTITLPDATGTVVLAPSSQGMLFGNTAGTTIGREITGGAGGGITVTDGTGASGNPTLAVDSTVARAGSGSGPPPKDCGNGGDTYQLGHFYTDTTNGVTSVCENVDWWWPVTQGRGGAVIQDEFVSNSTTNLNIGELSWGTSGVGGGMAVASISLWEEDQFMGISITETTSNDGLRLILRSALSTMWNGSDWATELIMVPGTGLAHAITDSGMYFGLSGNETTTGGVYLRRDTTRSDTNWVGVICDSATAGCQSDGDDTNQDVAATSTAPVAGDTQVLRIWRKEVGEGGNPTIYMNVDGGTPVTFCSSGCSDDLANLPAVNHTINIAFVARTISGGTRGWDIDRFRLAVFDLAR